MIEIILLAGAISVELEPYAIENPEAENYRIESNTDAYGRPFQWSTRRSKPGTSLLLQDTDSSGGGFRDGVERDAFGRPVEGEE
jgi:hypothetical protein